MAINKKKFKGVGEYWGGTVCVYDCLLDWERTLAFKKAIFRAVRPGDVVIDAGSGTGVLAMFASDAGAKSVYAIENDADILRSLEKTLRLNGYQDKIQIIRDDAQRCRVAEKADVLISEIIGSGLIEEDQIPVFNYLRRFLKPKAKVIPQRIDSFVDLVYSSRKHYKKDFFFPHYLDPKTHISSFSNTVKYLSVQFDPKKKISSIIQAKIKTKIRQEGEINGLRITSKTFFPSGEIFTSSTSYCPPLIFPLESIHVKSGQIYKLKLNYRLSEGINNVKYCLEKS